MAKGSMYSFQKWLMIGAALLVFATIFAQFPLSSSEPDMADYDLTDAKEEQQYRDDVDSFEGQEALFGAMATILQLTLVCYTSDMGDELVQKFRPPGPIRSIVDRPPSTPLSVIHK